MDVSSCFPLAAGGVCWLGDGRAWSPPRNGKDGMTMSHAGAHEEQGDAEWLVFVDESGDHSLEAVDADFPVFALCAVAMRRHDYVKLIIPAVAQLKVDIWGHEGVVLHGSDIRRSEGPFARLMVPNVRTDFMRRLAGLVDSLPFRVHVAVIDKRGAMGRPPPGGIYASALGGCLESLAAQGVINCGSPWRMLAESRGGREDEALRQAYEAPGGGITGERPRLEFAPKHANVIGLQLADLCARPLARLAFQLTGPDRLQSLLMDKIAREGGCWEKLRQ